MTSSPDTWSPLSFGAKPAHRIGPAWLPDLRRPGGGRAHDDEDVARLHAELETLRAERSGGEARVARAVDLLGRAAAQLEAIAHEFEHDRERNVQSLAIAIARSIVQRELQADPALVGTLVRRALDLLPLDTTLEIRLHPDDLAALGGEAPRLLPEGRALAVQWVPDETLEPGSFVIESPQRLVDGRTDVALRQLYERLEHE